MYSVISSFCTLLLFSTSVLALPISAAEDRALSSGNTHLLRSRDDTKNIANCASCHGLAGLTDPSGWSRNLDERGTAWDNIVGPAKPDLGPKVGLGGKPQPLYGNGWEQGRRAEGESQPVAEDLSIKEKRADVLEGKKTGIGKARPMGGCINCLRSRIKRWVSAPYVSSFHPSGSWKGGKPELIGGKKQAVVEKVGGGKVMPMGGCINCLRSRIKRWVAAPFPTSVYPSGSRKGQNGRKSTPVH